MLKDGLCFWKFAGVGYIWKISQNRKMRSLFFTFILTVCSLLSFAQMKSDIVRQKLKGRVKAITEMEFDVKKRHTAN